MADTPDDQEPAAGGVVPVPDPDLGGLGGAGGAAGLDGAGLGALGGGAGGGLDMGSLLQSAMQMQQDLLAAQQQAAEQVVEGVAGGGVVRVEVTGGLEFRRVTIDPEVVDPGDVELLQDLVLAALHDAVDRVQGLQAQAVPDLGALGLGDGGLDLGALFGGGPVDEDELEDDEDDEDVEDAELDDLDDGQAGPAGRP